LGISSLTSIFLGDSGEEVEITAVQCAAEEEVRLSAADLVASDTPLAWGPNLPFSGSEPPNYDPAVFGDLDHLPPDVY
jgi:hypothetical protein